MAVIGILAALAYPTYTESVRKSRRIDAMTDSYGGDPNPRTLPYPVRQRLRSPELPDPIDGGDHLVGGVLSGHADRDDYHLSPDRDPRRNGSTGRGYRVYTILI